MFHVLIHLSVPTTTLQQLQVTHGFFISMFQCVFGWPSGLLFTLFFEKRLIFNVAAYLSLEYNKPSTLKYVERSITMLSTMFVSSSSIRSNQHYRQQRGLRVAEVHGPWLNKLEFTFMATSNAFFSQNENENTLGGKFKKTLILGYKKEGGPMNYSQPLKMTRVTLQYRETKVNT